MSATVRYIHGGDAAITSINSPGVQTAAAAIEKGFGKKPLYQREGGSIPIVVQFEQLLGLDTVLLGFGLPDENAHAPDEFINPTRAGPHRIIVRRSRLPAHSEERR